MNEKELKEIYRYSETEQVYYLDIQIEKYRDAYSNWDYSPLVNRDLDDDLMDYLIDCSYEIPYKKSIEIYFHMPYELRDIVREQKSIHGMNNFFKYRIRKIKNDRIHLMRSTFLFLLIGTALLIVSNFTSIFIFDAFFSKLVSEGLVIGAWVMIWEMFSTWFFTVKNLSNRIKHYYRLVQAPIIFEYNKE